MTKRTTITLDDATSGLLDFLARSQDISQNEAIRRAIATEAYIQQEIQEGSIILVQKSNKEIREIVFR